MVNVVYKLVHSFAQIKVSKDQCREFLQGGLGHTEETTDLGLGMALLGFIPLCPGIPMSTPVNGP
jgi:hypothetical protein